GETDDGVHVQLVGEVDELVTERPPAHVRLETAQEDYLRVDATGDSEPSRRPLDTTGDAVDQTNRRAVDLVVVVVLGIDRGKRLCLPLPLEVLDRTGGRIGGVVPAFEGGEHRAPGLGHARSFRLVSIRPGPLPRGSIRRPMPAIARVRRAPLRPTEAHEPRVGLVRPRTARLPSRPASRCAPRRLTRG